MTPANPPRPDEGVSLQTHQILLLGLCAVGLVTAAFAAPTSPVTKPEPPDLPPTDDPNCRVTALDRPVPGRELTVDVAHEGEPAADAPVWFNGERVGRTDERGRVTGEVPYAERLRISVGLGADASCTFETDTTGASDADVGSLTAVAAPPIAALQPVGVETAPGSGVAGAQKERPNANGSITIHGDITFEISGPLRPGNTVTLVATVQGDPVPEATVYVDGERVGTTDERGRLDVAVPTDQRRMRVVVQRGELAADETLDLLVPGVSVSGQSWIPLPGGTATATATVGGDPVSGATVTVDGRQVGTTGPAGEVAFRLPVDPTATVTVRTDAGTASTPAAVAYAPTVVAGGFAIVAFVILPLALYWAGGRRVLAVVGSAVSVVLATVAGYWLAGRIGGVLAFACAVALVTLAVVAIRPRLASDAAQSASSRLERGVEWLTAQVLWTARGIETLVGQIRSRGTAVVDGVRDEDRSLVRGAVGWLARLPGRFLAALLFVAGAPGRIVTGLRSDDAVADSGSSDASAEPASDDSAPPIRELWRTFARSVVPEHWPRRTPGEVSRRAIESGFPRDAVLALTGVFRDVEYGDLPPTPDRHDRAREAFDALDRDQDDGDDAGVAEP